METSSQFYTLTMAAMLGIACVVYVKKSKNDHKTTSIVTRQQQVEENALARAEKQKERQEIERPIGAILPPRKANPNPITALQNNIHNQNIREIQNNNGSEDHPNKDMPTQAMSRKRQPITDPIVKIPRVAGQEAIGYNKKSQSGFGGRNSKPNQRGQNRQGINRLQKQQIGSKY